MCALIEKTESDGRRRYWTGEEWVSPNVTGWREAASFSDHEAASYELEQHVEADEEEFRNATIVDED